MCSHGVKTREATSSSRVTFSAEATGQTDLLTLNTWAYYAGEPSVAAALGVLQQGISFLGLAKQWHDRTGGSQVERPVPPAARARRTRRPDKRGVSRFSGRMIVEGCLQWDADDRLPIVPRSHPTSGGARHRDSGRNGASL